MWQLFEENDYVLPNATESFLFYPPQHPQVHPWNKKKVFFIYSSLSCWWKFTFLLAALQFLFCCWLRPSGVESHNFHPLKKENKTSSIWINLWTGFPKDRNWKLILSCSGSKKETRGSHGPPWGRKQQFIRRQNCFYKAPKSLILCFFNPTVKGTWIDQKVKKKVGPLRNKAQSRYCWWL